MNLCVVRFIAGKLAHKIKVTNIIRVINIKIRYEVRKYLRYLEIILESLVFRGYSRF